MMGSILFSGALFMKRSTEFLLSDIKTNIDFEHVDERMLIFLFFISFPAINWCYSVL